MADLPILVSKVQSGDGETKSIFRPDADTILEKVPIEKLRENLHSVCEGLSQVVTDVKNVGQFRLQEVTVQVEISAEGGVNLIGTATLAGKGAITLKFVDVSNG